MDFAAKVFVASIVALALFQVPPVMAQTQPASNITYTYNAKGERISKNVDGVVTRFVYDERGHLTTEISPTNTRDYIYLGDMLVSTVDTPKSPSASPSTVAYVTTDHTGNPRAASDASGNLIWQNPYKSNAWGDQPTLSNGYALNVRSVGSYFDPETGLVYNINRYYDPNTGRFMEPDPLGMAGGFNPYAAVSNNPLNRIDPDGLRDIFVGGAADGTYHIVESYYDRYHSTHPDSAYYSWEDLAAIIDDINNTTKNAPGDPINLIGHSYGGDTAAAAALKACGKVNLLITIDPVSRFHFRDMQAIKSSVGTWVDVDAEGGSPFRLDNFIAGMGGAWNGDPNGIADSYIQDNSSSHGDFRHMMNAAGPGINSPAQVLGGAPLVNPPFLQ
ncbi:RHS repeat-associated core domain-containing protein [Dyella terrae]|uniref:RHS repeat-associated core domain-containing protein n=1 Tax=Dyella terrae TaxID=522259 RepID=UPI001EFCC96B|nr:alpha/beta fold hydrolase [Dyella terrae]ULU25278.1 RHS repeat-associated core domain-containing protein [Dyella terrae]